MDAAVYGNVGETVSGSFGGDVTLDTDYGRTTGDFSGVFVVDQ